MSEAVERLERWMNGGKSLVFHADVMEVIADRKEFLDVLVAVKSTNHFHQMSKPLQDQISSAIAKAEAQS